MQINKLTAQQAVEWYKFGWQLFVKQPVQWLFLFLIFFVIAIVLNLIPLGGLVFMLLSPALFAGIFMAIKTAENQTVPPLGILFSVLLEPHRRNPFLMLGGLNILFNLLIAFILVGMVAGTVGLGALMGGGEAAMAAIMGAGLWMAMVILPLLLIYLMAMIYAIPLMLFHNLAIKESLLLSLKANLSNIVPMLIAGIVYLILAFLSGLVLGLGFIILIPVSVMAIYASYKDIFSGRPVSVQTVIEA